MTPTMPEATCTPQSYYDLLAMTPEQLAEVDIAEMNLLCAQGLPGAENIDISATMAKLDEWAAKVKFETERHLYRVTDPRYAEHYKHSEARFRAEFIVQVLQEDCGVRYNPNRIYEPDFRNSRDMFLHGMLPGANGGTCASMPVMYTAIGRRLGYPMKLVLAKQHIFCRWDNDKERFNIEGTGNGGLDYPPDEHYRSWPGPINDAEMASCEFLKSLTPWEELATFLLNRGTCFHANKRMPEARACLAESHRLMPKAPTPIMALRSTMGGTSPMRAAQQRHFPRENPSLPADIRRQMAPPPDPTPGAAMPGQGPGFVIKK